jgi:hypothetical protein
MSEAMMSEAMRGRRDAVYGHDGPDEDSGEGDGGEGDHGVAEVGDGVTSDDDISAAESRPRRVAGAESTLVGEGNLAFEEEAGVAEEEYSNSDLDFGSDDGDELGMDESV